MMKPILLVGHPLCGYARVEALLNVCGMQKPLPSRREGFSPLEVSEILRKAYLAHQTASQTAEIQQIEPGSIWHGMALDLMLGNLDQELWGWADPESIHLLEYWKSLDPKITFILVYNDPQTLLTERNEPSEDFTQEALADEVDKWCAYNRAVLNFFYRNPERCLLVHAQQVGLSANHYLQQVQAQIEMPLASPTYLLDTTGLECTAGSASGQVAAMPALTGEGEDPPHPPQAQPIRVWQAIGLDEVEDPLNQYLAADLIDLFPEARQVYEELQSVANLPLAQDTDGPRSPLAAWKLMADLRRQLKQQEAQYQQQQAQLQVLGDLKSQLEQQRDHLEQEKHALVATHQEHQQENELLLLQLHQVQEELERQFLTGKKTLEELNQDIAQITHAKVAAERLALERQQHLDQLAQAKAAAEKLALERQQQLEQANQAKATADQMAAERQQQLDQLAQAKTAAETLALERQKQLEQANQAKATADQMVAERQQQLDQLAQAKTAAEKLAEERQRQLEQAKQAKAAAEKQAAERLLKLEEATQAGNQSDSKELHEENELLLLQLHQVQEELERYYLENKHLKQQASTGATAKLPSQKVKTAPRHQPRYGAAERVKQQLSYRLGATMIANHGSLKGWLNMPFALSREVRIFKREQRMSGEQKLPPIARYNDAHEAERVKQHLSYRLGSAMIAHHKSPIGWLKMPWALASEVKEFKRRRAGKR